MGSRPIPALSFRGTFTSLADCSGPKFVFDNTEHASHVIQRWKAELLQFGVEIEHRGAKMMHECDMLSCYNNITEEWIKKAREEECREEANQERQAEPEAWEVEREAATAQVPAHAMSGPVLERELPPMRFSMPPPVCYSGAISTPTIGNRVWDPHRSVVVVTAIGVAVKEALASIEMVT